MTLIDFPKPKEPWTPPKTLEDWPWEHDLAKPHGVIGDNGIREPETNDLARYKDVTNPDHYKLGDIEVIQLTEKLGFCEGDVVKYVCRHKAKNGKEDLLKARWYLDRLIAGA